MPNSMPRPDAASDDVVLIEPPTSAIAKSSQNFFGGGSVLSNGASRSKASGTSTSKSPTSNSKPRQSDPILAPKRKSVAHETMGDKPKAKPETKSKANSSSSSKTKSKSQITSKCAISTLDKWLVRTQSSSPRSTPTPQPKEPQQQQTKAPTKPVDPAPKKKRFRSSHPSGRLMRVCRVCDKISSEHEISCAFQCAQCKMAVHKKCYDAKEDRTATKWFCRRCQFILDQKEQLDSSEEALTDEPDVTDVSSVEFPLYSPRSDETDHKLHALHGDSNFAVVFSFLHRFKSLGIKIKSFHIDQLADGLVDPTESPLMHGLHMRLLSNLKFSVAKNHNWQHNLFRFVCKVRSESAENNALGTKLEWLPSALTSKSLAMATQDDASASEIYMNLSVVDRVLLLKFLCEKQFDENESLVEHIGNEELEDLRQEPVGEDDHGRNYWLLEDEVRFWLCRCSKVDGSDWQTVCDDIDGLERFLSELSLSQSSRELVLWQAMRTTILQRLKRKKQAENRRAQVTPLPESSDGRVLRARKRINYNYDQMDIEAWSTSKSKSYDDNDLMESSYSSEEDDGGAENHKKDEEDEDKEEDEDDEDEDQDQDEDDEEEPTRRSTRQRRRVQYI